MIARAKRALALAKLSAGVLSLALLASARAETFPDCAKIEDALAYNRCLAAHGPAAGQTRVTTAPAGVQGGMQKMQGAYPFHREHNGRMSATITVEPRRPSAHSRKSISVAPTAF
jgi:hypothetical protein